MRIQWQLFIPRLQALSKSMGKPLDSANLLYIRLEKFMTTIPAQYDPPSMGFISNLAFPPLQRHLGGWGGDFEVLAY
jgi:hypothetical protein